MGKTGWIVLIVCLSIVLCICAGVFLAGRIFSNLSFVRGEDKADSSTIQGYKDLNNPYSQDGTYSVKMDALQKLEIDWIGGSVIIELTDSDILRFEESANVTIREKDALRYGVTGGKLRIQACKKNHTGSLPQKKLKVFLPRSLAEGMRECKLDTVSASITADGLALEELEVNTVSGKVTLSNTMALEAQVDTVSGQVVLPDCSFDSLRFDSVSGPIRVSGSVQKLKASSVSGDMELTLLACRDIRTNTMSGAVTMTLTETPRELNVDITSGDTRIALPTDASCTISLDTMSGKLYLNNESVGAKQITLGDGSVSFEIDSMSGSVYIYTK